MNILFNILIAIGCVIIGYLLGSANISIPLGKLIFKQDPRDFGSHNCGATNCGRLWGKKWFFIVFFFDVFKTIASLYICWALLTFIPVKNGHGLMPDVYSMYRGYTKEGLDIADFLIQWPVYWLACVGAVLGNIFPLFIRFKGGKAASTYLGLTITTSWGYTAVAVIVYFTTLFKSRYVSLSSIICGIVNVIVSWVWAILLLCKVIPTNLICMLNWAPILYCNYVYAIVMTILILVMIYRHHENIARIKAGTERKVHWMDRKKKEEASI